jgi:3-phosphoshikimate 1-carboxyvinyltransferase
VRDHRLHIDPTARIRGALRVPGDKSVSHRYALLAAIARGTTQITNLSPGADVAATLACVAALGARLTRTEAGLRIDGCWPGGLHAPAGPLDAANSGTTMRLLAGLLAGCPFAATLLGDASLSRRPMRRIIEPLTAMGATITSSDGCAPLHITGARLAGIVWRPAVASAQIKSAVLLAGLSAEGDTVVHEPAPTRDHTERAFPSFGLTIRTDAATCSLRGPQQAVAPAAPLQVPGDPSSAAVWAAAAAALPGSEVAVQEVGLNPHRLGFLAALERAGAIVTIEPSHEAAGEPVGTLRVRHGGHADVVIGAAEVPGLFDELPVLAARAALGGSREVSGAAELRVKESDRITALVTGLRALGVDAEERADGFLIAGRRRPTGGTADAAGDHRLVMAFALVALGATGPSVITDAGAVAVSYPDFAGDLARLSA